jgi:hypothetical protein
MVERLKQTILGNVNSSAVKTNMYLNVAIRSTNVPKLCKTEINCDSEIKKICEA